MKGKFLKHGFMTFLLLIILIVLALPFLQGREGVKLWSKELKYSGYLAVSFFIFTLLLTPLVITFPKISFFKQVNQHRRAIGLLTFLIILIHLGCFLGKIYLKKGGFAFTPFLRPYILAGVFAFLILVPLAVTSNNFSIKRLGYKRWKNIHRCVYVAEGMIVLHMLLQGGKELFWGILLFVILLAFQILRIKKQSNNLKT